MPNKSLQPALDPCGPLFSQSRSASRPTKLRRSAAAGRPAIRD
jgi:hypothetical protein